jgi:hypothetical protein
MGAGVLGADIEQNPVSLEPIDVDLGSGQGVDVNLRDRFPLSGVKALGILKVGPPADPFLC